MTVTGWRGHSLALIAGALVTPSLAPWNIWPLAIISAGLLAWLLTDSSPRQALLRGWLYGLGLFGSGSSWVYVSIHVYGYAPVPLALFLTILFCCGIALFCSLPCYLYARFVSDCPGGKHLGFAAVFVLGEWWRSWFLTGFPWLYLGYGHLQTPLAGWAPVAGVYAISFIVALSGATLALALMQRRMIRSQWLLLASLWLAGGLLQTIAWTQPKGEPIKVAMVQANIPQEQKWRPDNFQKTLDLYASTSAPLWAEHDLVIWPEAAIPAFYQSAENWLSQISQRAKAANSSLITGIPWYQAGDTPEDAKRYNSIIGLGAGSGVYFKQRLVPFGEYVPMEKWLRGTLQFFELPLSAFSSGGSEQASIMAGELSLAPFICYEVVYPELVSSWLPAADLLITISNDAWFGHSIGPLQHLEMAQMRALESGRSMLRATGTGVSAIIDQRGRIVVRGDQFSREVISGEAQVFTGATPFAITGSRPILLLCLLLCLGAIFSPLIQAKMRR